MGKADAGLDKSCTGVTLTGLGVCDATLAGLKTCAATAYGTEADDLFVNGYEYRPTQCPSILELKVLAGTSDVHPSTDTILNVGWTGLTHVLDLPDNYQSSIAIDTASCSGTGVPGSCGQCNVAGAATTTETAGRFMRCETNTRLTCDEPFGPDANDCGGSNCGVYLGPPLAGVSGNTPTCTLNRMAQDITGIVNPDSVEASVTLHLRAKVHQGPSKLSPCPVCGGSCAADPATSCSSDAECVTADSSPCDAGLCIGSGANAGNSCKNDADCITDVGPCNGDTPQDGQRDGVCLGGQADGQPCDIQGLNSTFGPVSLDCPPLSDANISGVGLNIVLPLTTGSQSMSFDNACDAPISGMACACGICSLNTDLPCVNDASCTSICNGGNCSLDNATVCTTNADCSASSAGTCTDIGDGVPRVPNGCNDLTCTPVAGQTDRGECLAGPTDTFCEGVTWANGKGLISCSVNADCSISSIGIDGGNCGLPTTRSCFLDPLVMTGTPGGSGTCNNAAGTGSGQACSYSPDCPWGETCGAPAVSAGVFCLPPTANAGVNLSSGSPGAASVKVAMEPVLSR